jgi:hypothetical protein
MSQKNNDSLVGAGSIAAPSPSLPDLPSSELTQDDLDMANLSNDSYNDKFESGSGNECTKFVVIDSINTKSGYDAVVYKNLETGEIIVAHRGTEFNKQLQKDLLMTDGAIAIGIKPKQVQDAIDFVKKIAKNNNIDPNLIRNIGHSLGGYLSEEVALQLGGKSNSFDSPQSYKNDLIERQKLMKQNGAQLRIIISSPNAVNSGIGFVYKVGKLIIGGDLIFKGVGRVVTPIEFFGTPTLKDSHDIGKIINRIDKAVRHYANTTATHDLNILTTPSENTKSAAKSLNNICSGI